MSPKQPARDWKSRVEDIVREIDEIEAFVQGMDRFAFATDARTLRAVLANFTIIGEATGHVPPEVRERAPQVAWRQMRDMRNIIVHVYFAVEPSIVWDTIKDDLPTLKDQLTALLVLD